MRVGRKIVGEPRYRPPPDVLAELRGKKATTLSVMEWVFNNAGLAPTDIDWKTCPCPGAIRLVGFASTGEGYKTFIRDLYSKTVPARSQLEAEERQRDERKLTTLLDNMEREFYGAGTQRPPAEPSLSQGSSGVGPHEQAGAGRDLVHGKKRPDLVHGHVSVDVQPEGLPGFSRTSADYVGTSGTGHEEGQCVDREAQHVVP